MKRMLMRKPFSKMEGLTLLETMFAIAIGALVLIGAIIFYMSTKNSATVSKVMSDMNGITAAADTYIASGNSATNLTDDAITTLQTAGLLPTPMNTPFGVPYAATVSGNKINIVITGLGLSDAMCTTITSTVANTQSQGVAAGAGTTSCNFDYTL